MTGVTAVQQRQNATFNDADNHKKGKPLRCNG